MPVCNEKTAVGWKRNAALFVGGQFLSSFGSMLVSHAVTWHITVTRQSATLMALFTCAAMLPMVFVSPPAGVWADRYSRKHLVNISDAAIALVTLAVALCYGMGLQSVWLLLAAVTARSVGQGVQQPAAGALIPQIVPAEHLARFNGIQSASQSLTMFASPMAAAALLSFLPLSAVFYIDVATAAVGIATVFFFVKVPLAEKKPRSGGGVRAYYAEMAAGLRFIGGHAWIRTMFIASAAFGILASPAAMLTPLQVTLKFGGEMWRLSSIQLAFSAGMMAGGVAISVWGGFRNKAHTMVLAWLMFGCTTVLLGVAGNYWAYLAVMALCGCTLPLYNTPAVTLLQTRVPPQLTGRVFGAVMMLNGLAMPLGMALFGPLGDAAGIDPLLIATGALLLCGGLWLRTGRAMVSAGEPETPGETEKMAARPSVETGGAIND